MAQGIPLLIGSNMIRPAQSSFDRIPCDFEIDSDLSHSLTLSGPNSNRQTPNQLMFRMYSTSYITIPSSNLLRVR